MDAPLSFCLDLIVHGVGSEIDLAGPADGTVIDVNLTEKAWISEGSEHASGFRIDEVRQIDSALCAVEEFNRQPLPV
jgi:hypothetical protein